MEPLAERITDLLLDEVRRRIFEEGQDRIHRCLESLSEAEVWHRPNDHMNSVGNLVLHLCGNIRQWVVAGLGGKPDHRQRAREFLERGPLPKQQLLDLLTETLKEVAQVLDTLKASDLERVYPVQVYEENGVSMLVHVTEHFSYHVGQMTYLVKLLKDKDMGYYEEALE